jgi:hypothetical protein
VPGEEKSGITIVTLVTGARANEREAAISAALHQNVVTAMILEGLPDGGSGAIASGTSSNMLVSRIAPGCMCCTGNLVMRVTLNRLLRQHPARLFISLATTDHLAQIRHFLTEAPYDTLLNLTDDLAV